MPKYAKGDPHNQAVVLHYDGWNPDSTSSKSNQWLLHRHPIPMNEGNLNYETSKIDFPSQYIERKIVDVLKTFKFDLTITEGNRLIVGKLYEMQVFEELQPGVSFEVKCFDKRLQQNQTRTLQVAAVRMYNNTDNFQDGKFVDNTLFKPIDPTKKGLDAVLIDSKVGHGWVIQTKHSIAAITITNGCMQKSERAGNKMSGVYSFIPVHQLPTGNLHKLDAFFEPLIEDLCSLYIDSEQVLYAKKDFVCSEGEESTPTLRVIPLLLTADMIAHAEVGLVCSSGKSCCRRCMVEADYINNHNRPGDFQYRSVYPCQPKSAEEIRCQGKKADCAKTNQEKHSIRSKYGVTGESPLYTLYDLCGLDPIKDGVIDIMHALSLNLVKSELKRILADLGSNRGKEPMDRDPKVGGILTVTELESTLDSVS